MSEPLIKPASWISKLELINQLVLQHNVLISVFAEREGGKTSFFKMLDAGLNTSILPITVRATPPFDEKNMLYKISQECDFLRENAKSLNDLVLQINQSQKHVLLMIDDAQHLPMIFIESILMVMKAQGPKSYFHVCLASGYSLVETLNKLASGSYQNLIQGVELGLFTLAETEAFVFKKLASTEKNYNKVLTPANLDEFYALTQGRLALMNRHVYAFFETKLIMRKWKMPVSKQLAAMLFAIGIVAFGGVAVWQAQGIETTDVDDLSVELILSKPEVVKQKENQERAYLKSILPSYQEGSKHIYIEPALMKKSEQFQFARNTEDAAFNPDLVMLDKVVVVPKKVASASLAAVKNIKNSVDKPTPTDSHKLISGYTIQFIASRELKDIQKFKARYHFTESVYIMRSNRQGVTWYVLTTGQFSSRQEANMGLKKLPESLRALNPWVRPTQDLQNLG